MYPLFKVHVDSKLAATKIVDVFESGFINEGQQVTELTDLLKARMATNNLMLVNSCTSAITLALRLAGAGPGTKVVSTPMTCVASNTPIVASGADIVWADVDPRHGMVSERTLRDALFGKKDIKAVIVVAWAGNPPDLKGLADVCTEFNVKLILDAAHAFDATYDGRPIHEFADYACYSFQAIKHFTTGDGGALVCRYDDEFSRGKALKWFGLDRDNAKDASGNWKGQQWDVDIVEAGYKFNMNNVAAAIGLSQVPHIDDIIKAHRHHSSMYDELFRSNVCVRPNDRVQYAHGSSWVYAMQIDPDVCRMSRHNLLSALNAEGIMAGVVHVPNDTYTAFKRYTIPLPGVRTFSENQFALPCGWWLSEDDVEHIAHRVMELVK